MLKNFACGSSNEGQRGAVPRSRARCRRPARAGSRTLPATAGLPPKTWLHVQGRCRQLAGLALVRWSRLTGDPFHIPLPPALADGDDHRGERRDERHDNDRQKERHHADRGQREHAKPHYYPAPVYVPPPVYYPPQQSPGISLFLPLDIHIR
jgi:hypothetical protein